MSEEFEKLDSPLVVHKETDASYLETANIDIVSTAKKIEENKTSLVRHRFKKNKKKSKLPYFILLIVVIASVYAVFILAVLSEIKKRIQLRSQPIKLMPKFPKTDMREL